MTLGDNLSVVLGSDGKYYSKYSGTASIGDYLQTFRGTDGKLYSSKSGSTSLGSNVLVSIGADGKYLAHISKTPYNPTYTQYRGWGGGDEAIYTLWYGFEDVYKLSSHMVTIEKRDPETLKIIESTDVRYCDDEGNVLFTLPAVATGTAYYGYIGGNLDYLYIADLLNSAANDYFKINIHDTKDNYNLVATIEIPTGDTFWKPWFTFAGDILTITLGVGYSVGCPDYYAEISKYIVYPLSLIDSYTMQHCSAPSTWNPCGGGDENYVYELGSGGCKKVFPGAANVRCGDTFSDAFSFDTVVAYSKILPLARGSDTCTGYTWNLSTMRKTAL